MNRDHRGLITSKRGCVAALAAAEIASMAVWFSASAVLPALKIEYALTNAHGALLASAVSLGFVTGTLLSALLGWADRLDQRRYFAVSALVASAANGGMILVDPSTGWTLLLRFLVGASAAGIYPVGMRMVAAWARVDMGLLVGVLVGAQVLGLSLPYLIDALGGLAWRATLATSSVLAVLGAILVMLVSLGPNLSRPVAFRASTITAAWRIPSLRLANIGYLGHMWELFAMWGWVGIFLVASFSKYPGGPEAVWWAKIIAFASVAAGAPGCLAGGLLADRYGRTTVVIGALAVSGACCLSVGFFFAGNPLLLAAICIVWGATVVADSPQFSASVAELSPPTLVGTMITLQTCAGFLLTTATIQLMPLLADLVGWERAFMVLSVGPIVGIAAMLRLRRRPEAALLANGNR